MKTLTNQDIAEYVLENKGATVALLGGARLIDERDGDVYSVGGSPDRFGNKIHELPIPRSEFDADAVQDAIDYVTLRRRGLNADWHGVGFWIDTVNDPDTVIADAIDVVMGRELAISLGTERGERAIWGALTDEVISL